MSDESYIGYIIKKEVVFTNSFGMNITKITCRDGKIWYLNTSYGIIGNDIGKELKEDSDGNVINEHGKFIDINDDRLGFFDGDLALERDLYEMSKLK